MISKIPYNSRKKHPVQIEACCGSVADIVYAARAGVERVELNSALFLGGLTPSFGEFCAARQLAPDVKIMVMIRPRSGGFCYDPFEFRTMLEDAVLMLNAGADGIVFGFLHEDGTVDLERIRRRTD